MLKKLSRKFKQLGVKQLTTMLVVSLILTVIVTVLLAYTPKGSLLAPSFGFISLCLIGRFILYPLLIEYNITSGQVEEKTMSKLRLLLSSEEYREVEFLPDITRYNGFASWEDENLDRCLEILNGLQVKHLAKIDGNAVIVIAEDKSGNMLGCPKAYTPQFFTSNYKILK